MDYKQEAIELAMHALRFPSLLQLCLVDFFDGVAISCLWSNYGFKSDKGPLFSTVDVLCIRY